MTKIDNEFKAETLRTVRESTRWLKAAPNLPGSDVFDSVFGAWYQGVEEVLETAGLLRAVYTVEARGEKGWIDPEFWDEVAKEAGLEL